MSANEIVEPGGVNSQPEAEAANVPLGWKLVTVRDVIQDLKYGTAQKCSYEPRGTPVLRIPNVANGNIDHSDLKFAELPEREFEQLRLAPGDLLLIRSNGSVSLVGRCAVVQEREKGFAFAGYLIRLRPERNLIDSKFFSLALSSQEVRVQIEVPARSTSGVNNINSEEVRSLSFPLPPRVEQHRIVTKVEALMDEINTARDRLAKVPTILKRFRQSLLAAACSGKLTDEWRNSRSRPPTARDIDELRAGRRALWERRTEGTARGKYKEPFEAHPPDDVELPDGWKWVTVSHLALLDVGFAFKSAEFEDDGVRLLRGENVEPGSLRWTETRFWANDKLDEFRHLLVEPGEIILAMDRPIVSAGLKIARVKPTDVPALLVQRVMRPKMVVESDTDYLYWCLSHRRFIDFLAHEGMTGSDLPHITGTGVAEFPIPLPPAEEQREIVARLEAFFAWADQIERGVANATIQANRLPQSILAKALSGELVPTEAELARAEGREYEPASVLLERVKVEGGQQQNGAKKRRLSRGDINVDR